jgi:hypothetical protein
LKGEEKKMSTAENLNLSSESQSEYQVVYDEIKMTIKECTAQNKKLVDALKFYAKTDWRDLTLLDRGDAARKLLKEVTGK